MELMMPTTDKTEEEVLSARAVEPSVNERLRTNDPSLTRLDVTSATFKDFSLYRKMDFLHSLRANSVVKTVHLSASGLQQVWTRIHLEELVDAICCLPRLEELFVFKGDNHVFTEEILANALLRAEQLTVLMLWDFSDFRPTLAGAIRQLPVLERITISLPHDLPWAAMDVYVMGLAEHETLQCLSLRCQGGKCREAVVSPEAMHLLLTSTSIHTLYLENLGLTDDHTDAMADELRHSNRVLKSLDIKSNYFSDDALYTFAGMLPHNKTLTSIDLSGVVVTEGGGRKLAEAMQHNRVLTNLELEGYAERYVDEFHIPEASENTDWHRALDFYIRLNRAGHDCHQRPAFVESLNSVSDHLGCLYHVLRQHPEHVRNAANELQTTPIHIGSNFSIPVV
jgi:hypothetical protein